MNTSIFWALNQQSPDVEKIKCQDDSEMVQILVKSNICPPQYADLIASKAFLHVSHFFAQEHTTENYPSVWQAFMNFARQETQNLQKRMSQNFDLTEIQFNEMVEKLQNGDKTMFEWVFLSHFSACRTYLIKNYRANAEDAYDATMDTLLTFHRLLLENKVQYGNLRYLFTKMSTQVYLKSHKKQQRLGQQDTKVDLLAEEEYDKESERQLAKAWDKLGEGCRRLLQAFYYDGKGLNVMAEELGKDHAAIRKQKQRCVDTLRVQFNRFA